MKVCRTCHSAFPDEYRNCPRDGSLLEPQTLFGRQPLGSSKPVPSPLVILPFIMVPVILLALGIIALGVIFFLQTKGSRDAPIERIETAQQTETPSAPTGAGEAVPGDEDTASPVKDQRNAKAGPADADTAKPKTPDRKAADKADAPKPPTEESRGRADQTDTTQPRRISGGVLNGKAISLPKPPYPPAARAVRASGAVNVQVLVDTDGRVTSANAVSGHPLLRPAAVNAARQARFTPTMVAGRPVQVSGVLTYNFIAPD